MPLRASAHLWVSQVANPWEGDALALHTRTSSLHTVPCSYTMLPLREPVRQPSPGRQPQQASAPLGATLSLVSGSRYGHLASCNLPLSFSSCHVLAGLMPCHVEPGFWDWQLLAAGTGAPVQDILTAGLPLSPQILYPDEDPALRAKSC